MNSDASDIADGIIQEKSPEHITPLRTVFEPWHRVRKQYVRRNQWNELAKRNVKDTWRADLQRPSAIQEKAKSTMNVSQPLRCLVIPGSHLLDVRSMWNEVSPLDCFIRYLGFNEGHGSGEVGTDMYIANNAVTSLSGVISDSQVIRDRFESIARTNTLAYRHLRQYGPYHVVNLDLCGSMFPNTAQSVEPYFSALDRLLKYQFEAQKASWLLFITTMVEPGVMDQIGMKKLCKPAQENFDANMDFAAKIGDLLPRAAFEGSTDEEKSVNLNGLSKEDLVRLFGVALGKWLLRMGQGASPKWTVEMRRSFRYPVNERKGAVLLSLAFEMIPNFAPPVDATGMSKLTVTPKQFASEGESAVKLAVSVLNIVDVEQAIAADEAMKASLRDEAADLMASAGFDRAAYIKWVDGGEVGT